MTIYRGVAEGPGILGAVVLPIVTYRNTGLVQELREKYGLNHIQSQQRYSIQNINAFMAELVRRSASAQALVDIGQAIAAAIDPPPDLADSSESEMMQRVTAAYPAQSLAAQVHSQILADNHLKVTLNSPLPDDCCYGLILGSARRFLPPGSYVVIWYGEPGARQHDGGHSTVIHLEWF